MASRSYQARGPNPLCWYQSRPSLSRHRTSLCGILKPVLETLIRVEACARAAHVPRRLATSGLGARLDKYHRAAQCRGRCAQAARIYSWKEETHCHSQALSPSHNCPAWRHDLSYVIPRIPERTHQPRAASQDLGRPPCFCPAESQRSECPLFISSDAHGVPRAAQGDTLTRSRWDQGDDCGRAGRAPGSAVVNFSLVMIYTPF